MLLTVRQHRTALALGAGALAGIFLLIGVALATLLLWQGSVAESRLLTPYTFRILGFTLWQAGLSTILSLLFALPIALALARRPTFSGRIWIIRLMALPMGLPVLIGALGLIGIWGRQGLFNQALVLLGLGQPVSIYGLSGILLAHVFFNMPLAVRLLLAALERQPAEYWLLSASLGMRPFSVLRFIEWPAIRAVLPGAAGLIFMLCATSFTLVLLLGGGPAATTLEVAIYQALRFDFDPARVIALSVLQIGLTALVMSLLGLLPKPGDTISSRRLAGQRFDGRTSTAALWDIVVISLGVLFTLMPLVAIVQSGLRANLMTLVTSRAFIAAAGTSLKIAVLAGATSVLLALAVTTARHAIAQSRKTGPASRLFHALLGGSSSLVLLVPPVVIGTGWFLALRGVGANTGTTATILIILINALMSLPFVMRVMEPALDIHRQRTARLCASLGISGLARLRWIDLPILAPPLLTALSFAMALSLGDLGAVAIFGSSDLTTLPWLVYSRLSSYRSQDADGLALLLGMLCVLLTVIGTMGARLTTRKTQNG